MQAKQTTFWRGPGLFILPTLVLYIFFVLIPLWGVIALTFFQWGGVSFRTLKFIGLYNYKKLLEDPIFWQSVRNTLIFAGLSVSLQCTIGLILALLLEQNLPFAKFFRATYFLPAIISLVIVSLVFEILFSPALGVLHTALKPIHLEGLAGFGFWFADTEKAIYGLALVQVWYGFGWSMFIFISGLESINPELYQAAEVDGASGWQRIIYITLPLLKGTASVAVLIATMWAIKVFALPFVMTKGGPAHATEMLSTWAYQKAFFHGWMGYGSGVAIVLLMLGFLIGFFIFKFTAMGKTE